MDVALWLRSLGLGRYESAFHDNAIDADVLADLTDGDLAQLGVNLGDRKRLLKAIAGLRSEDSRKGRTSTTDAVERRPITVLFCDLVGSTSIAAKLDAEDWRNLVGSYLDAASAAVTALGGRVQDRFGDGLMVLFGYPRAQENDAERAVRAALAIQRALDELNARNAGKGEPLLAARIGLESGQVVVDATGAVFGEAPNVAARVQSLAEPGAVVVTAGVQRQVAGLFVAEDRGLHELKGMPAPVALYRIIRASGGGRRGGARALTPFVGRDEQVDRLVRHWERARSGEGESVLVVGEPGIGKSRLIREFRARLGETPHTWVEWSSSQLLQNTPLHPIVEWGRLRFGGADATDAQRLADLETMVRSVGLDAAEYAPLMALLVDGPSTEGRRPRFAPAELRRRQLAAITGLILGQRARAADDRRVRGFAVGRSHLARSDARAGRARRSGAAAPHRHRATGVPAGLELGTASQRHRLVSARSHGDRTHGPPARLDLRAVFGSRRRRERAERRRAAVRRRGHAPPAGARRRGRRAGDPADVAAVARRPARSARTGSGDRADRRRARPRLPARAPPGGRRRRGGRASAGPGAARRGRHSFRRRRGAAGDLPLPARADPGRGVREPAEEPPAGAAPARRRIVARRPRARGGGAGGDRETFHRSGARRPGRRMVGQGGRPGVAPLGLPGGDRPSRQGDRHGRQGGGRCAAGDRRLGADQPAADGASRRLRQRADRGARLCGAGDDRSLRQSA